MGARVRIAILVAVTTGALWVLPRARWLRL